MSIFDALDFGATLLTAGRAMKAQKKLKAEHPEAYQCHLLLGKVCIQSPLNFDAVGTSDGRVLYYSQKLIRGFNQPEFKCYAFVMPEELLIQFVYTPEDAQFVTENSSARDLLNWVNARLSIGRFFVQNTFTNNVGRQINQLAYGVEVDCRQIPHDQLEKILTNVLDDIIAFRELFLPIIEPASQLKLSFDAQGEPVGQSAAQALQKFHQALAKRNSIIVPGRREQLERRLADILGRAGYSYEQDTEKRYFIVKPQSESEGDLSLHVIANPFSQIVVQSYTQALTEAQCYTIRGSENILLANRQSGGNFHINLQDRRVIFCTAVDARGIEADIHGEWVTKTILKHLPAQQTYMQGLQNLENEHFTIGELISRAQGSTQTVQEAEVTPEIPGEVVSPIDRPKPSTPIIWASSAADTSAQTQAPEISRQKSRTTALMLEILPGLIGLLGFGWLYSGNVVAGLLILIGMIVVDIFALSITGGNGVVCLFPFYLILIGFSALRLNNYAKKHPEIFNS